jgi:hypothetical protein
MSPAFLMFMAALVAVVVWAILDKKALDRRINKRLEEEKAFKEKLTAFRAKQASNQIKRVVAKESRFAGGDLVMSESAPVVAVMTDPTEVMRRILRRDLLPNTWLVSSEDYHRRDLEAMLGHFDRPTVVDMLKELNEVVRKSAASAKAAAASKPTRSR